MAKLQNGFTIVEAILAMVIVGIIGGTAWYTWNSQKQAEKNLSGAESSSNYAPPTKIQDCELDKQTLPEFGFNKGCFTITFPSSLTIQQIGDGGRVINLQDFSMDDTNFSFSSLGDISVPPSKVNNFGGSLYIYDTSQKNNNNILHIEDGTVKKLKNGISIWTTNSKYTEVNGDKFDTKCPIIYLISNGVSEQKLKNGRYLSFFGSFCWGQGFTTTYTYDQQINSKEFKAAIDMLESITFQNP